MDMVMTAVAGTVVLAFGSVALLIQLRGRRRRGRKHFIAYDSDRQ